MSRLKIISPVHIGSGESYENFLIYQGNRYDFDDFVSHAMKDRQRELMSPGFLKNLQRLSYNNSGDAKERIRDVLLPSDEQIALIEPQYPVRIKLTNEKLNEKSIFAFVKTMNRPYMPGSSLKGYLLNVLFYDMLSNEAEIRNYVREQLRKAVDQLWDRDRPMLFKSPAFKQYARLELDVLTEASQFLLCRDFMFDRPMSIYYVSRQTKKGQIPQVAEFLDADVEQEGDVIVVDSIKHRRHYDSSIKDRMVQALITRIENMQQRLPEMNRAFLMNTLSYQKAFVAKRRNDPKVNSKELNDQIAYIERKLEEGAVVMQLGKYTNYITKSNGMALGLDFYEEYFKEVFRPDRKTNLFTIGTMNLMASPDDDEDFDQIPGYVEFEW